MSMEAGNDSEDRPGPWWDWRLLAVWIVVNAAACVVIVFGGVALELLASDTTRALAGEHRVVAVLLVALIGAAAAYEFGQWVLTGLSLPKGITPAFPLLGFLIHGVWMLWVTAPEAAGEHRSARVPQERHKTIDPGPSPINREA